MSCYGHSIIYCTMVNWSIVLPNFLQKLSSLFSFVVNSVNAGNKIICETKFSP